jgi:hypothetical protein
LPNAPATIGECRLRTADVFDAEAARLERIVAGAGAVSQPQASDEQ